MVVEAARIETGIETGTVGAVEGTRATVDRGTVAVSRGTGGRMGTIVLRCLMVGASDRQEEGANRGGAGGEVFDADLPPAISASDGVVRPGWISQASGRRGWDAVGGSTRVVGDPGQADVWADDVGRCKEESRGCPRGHEDRSCGESSRRLCREMPRDDRRDALLGEGSASGNEYYYERSRNYRSLSGAFVGDATWDHSFDDHRDLCRDADASVPVSHDLGAGPECSGRSAGFVPSATRVGWRDIGANGTGNNGFVGESSADRKWHGPVSAGWSGGRTSSSRDGTYSCEAGEVRDQDGRFTDGMDGAERGPCGRRAMFEEQQERHAVCAGEDRLCAGRVARRDGEGIFAVEGVREGRAGDCETVWCDVEGRGDQRRASVQAWNGCEGSGCSSTGGGERDGGRRVGEDGARPPRGLSDGLPVPGRFVIDPGSCQTRKVPTVGARLGTSGTGSGGTRVAIGGVYDLLSEVEVAAGYAMCPLSGVGLERGPSNSCSGESGRDLPTPIVETVDVESLLPWVLEGDRWILEAMCSWGCFVRHVLGSEGELAGVVDARLVNVSASRLRRMVELRYVRRIRIGSSVKGGVACAVMFVPKDDEFDRLIWNGIPLNRRCRRPPPVAFVPIHEMLRALGTSRVVWALSYDFATWFIQLRVHPDVQRVFLVRCQDGSLWRITGVPMGFAWAPVVAQVIAESIVAEALRRIDDERVRAFIYIDNVMLFFEGDCDSSFVESVDRVFRQVCAEAGAVLKESAFVSGVQQDWLGIELVVGQSRAQLRRRFCEKVAALWDVLRDESAVELQVWWRMCALVVRSLWVTARPLATVGDVMSWMSRKAKEMQEGRVGWRTKVDMWSLARRQLAAVVDWVRLGGSFRIVVPADRVIACGVSDAASAGAARGFVFRVGRRLRMVRMANDDDGPHINVLEFQAAVAGIKEVWQSCTESGWLVWGSDSMVAMGWIRLGWSPEIRRNGMLLELFDVMRKGVDRELRLVKVPGGPKNVADVLTRNGCGMLAKGRSWCRDGWLSCECRGICRHAMRLLWDTVGVDDVEEALDFPEGCLLE